MNSPGNPAAPEPRARPGSAGRPKANDVVRIFHRSSALIGMIHLRPLPGASRYEASAGIDAVYDQALAEARILQSAGFDGLIVENGGDVPFLKPDEIGPETIAALAVATRLLTTEVSIPIGVNCLANAVEASVAVAVAARASFVRANQWVNAYIANEGFVEGQAGRVARYRRLLGAEDVTVWADVQVKLGSHAITADRSIAEQARDADFFDADALIVTGRRLADPPLANDLQTIRDATALAIVVGSGVTEENVGPLLAVADGAIVGSALKEGGVWWGDLSRRAVEAIARARDAAATARVR